MAIALTVFQGLCGFRPVEQILAFLHGESQRLQTNLHCRNMQRNLHCVFLQLLTNPWLFVPAVPEFRAVVGDAAAEELRCSVGDAAQTRLVLKKCFTRMMNCEKKLFVDQLNMLVKRVTEEGEQSRLASAITMEGTSGAAVISADVCGVCAGLSGAIRRLLSGAQL